VHSGVAVASVRRLSHGCGAAAIVPPLTEETRR
jgi:hypothetical protein